MVLVRAEEPALLAGNLLDVVSRVRHNLQPDALRDLATTISRIFSLLQNELNDHAPIHTLPPELLSTIFWFTLDDLEPHTPNISVKSETSRAQDVHLRARLTLTSVCQRWRIVARSTASLWTVLSLPSPSAHVFGTLSQEMPLQLLARVSSDRVSGHLTESVAGRVRHLALSIPPSLRATVPEHGAPLFSFKIPHLESLSVSTACRPFDENRPALDFSRPMVGLFPSLFHKESDGVPRTLIQDDSPYETDGAPQHLRRLALSNTCWAPAVPVAHLTHFRLARGPPTPLAPLLSFLAQCTALTHFGVEDVYIAYAQAVPEDARFPLKRLRVLDLAVGQPMLQMRRLVQHLVLPKAGDDMDGNMDVRIRGAYALRALRGLTTRKALTRAFTSDATRVEVEVRGERLRVCAGGGRTKLVLALDEVRAADVAAAATVVGDMVDMEQVTDVRLSGGRECEVVWGTLAVSRAAPGAMRVHCGGVETERGVEGLSRIDEFAPSCAALNTACFMRLARLPFGSSPAGGERAMRTPGR
ncbi:uncharacterized protein BXZ73DRAFT_78265 [Epithele typhae]|uniref:uncharacterized protein n=1 Tax=Epithele typhae TaxID=378194 RepID=UPI00200872F5|nr:uncharacterized protein BXZ73DRAFT_78265 [Epithele typhae]KAH9928439.1 hypothetical protein BXZ73DRAFT_78265 [Epithele typhae]